MVKFCLDKGVTDLQNAIRRGSPPRRGEGFQEVKPSPTVKYEVGNMPPGVSGVEDHSTDTACNVEARGRG